MDRETADPSTTLRFGRNDKGDGGDFYWEPSNRMDRETADPSTTLRFGRDIAGTINAMFDFAHPDARPYILDKSTGKVLTP